MQTWAEPVTTKNVKCYGNDHMEYRDASPTVQAEEMLRYLTSGMTDGESFPSERTLTEMIGISRTSLRAAITQLRNSGEVTSQERRGMTVNKKAILNMLDMSSMSDELNHAGKKLTIRFLNSQIRPAEPVEKAFLTVGDGKVVEISRVRDLNEVPVTFERAVLIADKFPQLEKVDFTNRSLYQTLASKYQIKATYGREEIAYCAADDFLASKLSVQVGEPLYRVVSRTYDQHDQPLEYTTQYLVGKHIKYRFYAKGIFDYREDDTNDSV
jgi:DNA-binding GntR family transcriptional regulator